MFGSLIAKISSFVLGTINGWGYLGIFALMTLESANIPIPSEIIMPFSGFLASRGAFNFWFAVTVGALGNLAGSLISYALARPLEPRLQGKKHFLMAEAWFKRFGELSVFIGRLVPIVRTFISFPAGLFKVKLGRFVIYTFIGSFLWSLLLTYIGFVLGENWIKIEPYFRKFDYLIAVALIVFLGWFIYRRRKAQ
ncbi:MAG: DedA family protein [Candidatus Colwellbacteria bacterium]|nr:DedA family protein [Candidatus Colwellbacteria bacterium]